MLPHIPAVTLTFIVSIGIYSIHALSITKDIGSSGEMLTCLYSLYRLISPQVPATDIKQSNGANYFFIVIGQRLARRESSSGGSAVLQVPGNNPTSFKDFVAALEKDYRANRVKGTFKRHKQLSQKDSPLELESFDWLYAVQEKWSAKQDELQRRLDEYLQSKPEGGIDEELTARANKLLIGIMNLGDVEDNDVIE